MKATGIKSILILGLACAMLFPYSCANTTTPPSGGPKDTIPPVLLKVVPENGTTGFPLTGGKVTFTYDEYSVVKTSSEIVVSPPSKRRPTTKVRGKSIVISFQDTLQPDRTYSIVKPAPGDPEGAPTHTLTIIEWPRCVATIRVCSRGTQPCRRIRIDGTDGTIELEPIEDFRTVKHTTGLNEGLAPADKLEVKPNTL